MFFTLPCRKSSYPVYRNTIVSPASCFLLPKLGFLFKDMTFCKGPGVIDDLFHCWLYLLLLIDETSSGSRFFWNKPISILGFMSIYLPSCLLPKFRTWFECACLWFRGAPSGLRILLCQEAVAQLLKDDLSPFHCPQEAQTNLEDEEKVVCKLFF